MPRLSILPRRLLVAVSFLTRIPMPGRFRAADIGRAAMLFPLVGAGIGTLQLALWKVVSFRYRDGAFWWNEPWLPPLLAAALMVSFSAWLTGGLHLDGLADCADGFGGAWEREKTLHIMRDSRVGAFGATALVLVLVIKVAALGALVAKGEGLAFVVLAPALARWSVVPLGYFLPYARSEDGLGRAVTDELGRAELVGATLLVVVLVAGIAPRAGAVAWLAVVGSSLWMARVSMKRLNGITGDLVGAHTEVAETMTLVVGVALSGWRS